MQNWNGNSEAIRSYFHGKADSKIRVRIQRQYNNSPFPDVLEGGEK